MKISVNTIIESSSEKVWQAITDFENCPNWINGILSLKVLEQPQEGLIGFKWQETRKMARNSKNVWQRSYRNNVDH